MATVTLTRQRQRSEPTLIGRAVRLHSTRVGIGVTVAVVLLALIGPFAAPYGPTAFAGLPYSGPSAHSLLGTDYIGRDVLSLVLYGGRTILWMAFAAATLGVAVGTALGVTAAYVRNGLDEIIMRSFDVINAFPSVVFVLLFVSLAGHNPWLIVLLVGISKMPSVARVIRGVSVEVASRDHIAACDAIGVPRVAVIGREILPNIAPNVLVEYTLHITWAVIVIASLSFLGFGTQPPDTDWGLMVNQNRTALLLAPLATIVPVACIAALTLGTNLIGEGFAQTLAGVRSKKADR